MRPLRSVLFVPAHREGAVAKARTLACDAVVLDLEDAIGPDAKDEAWVAVRVEPVRALERPVTLKEIKAEPSLKEMELLRQSRLSVAPVRPAEWKKVLAMAAKPA